jgi:hypothetical protein
MARSKRRLNTRYPLCADKDYSHGNLIARVLRSVDAAFGFAQWRGLSTLDLFEVQIDAGRPVGFVRLAAMSS